MLSCTFANRSALKSSTLVYPFMHALINSIFVYTWADSSLLANQSNVHASQQLSAPQASHTWYGEMSVLSIDVYRMLIRNRVGLSLSRRIISDFPPFSAKGAKKLFPQDCCTRPGDNNIEFMLMKSLFYYVWQVELLFRLIA